MEKSNNIEKTQCYKHTCECNRSTSFRTHSRKYRGKRKKVKYKSDKHHALCSKCFYGQEEFVYRRRRKWSHKHRKDIESARKAPPIFSVDMLIEDMPTENILSENNMQTSKGKSKELQQPSTFELDAQYLDWSSYTPPERISTPNIPDSIHENHISTRVCKEEIKEVSHHVLLLTNNVQNNYRRILHYSEYQSKINTFNQSLINERRVHLFVQKFFQEFTTYMNSAKQSALYTPIHHFSTDIIHKLRITFTYLLQHIVDRQHYQWYLPNEEQSPALLQYLSKAYEKTKIILLLIEALVPSRQLEYQAS